jgi:DNA-binding transcriptional ArsR family regulator
MSFREYYWGMLSTFEVLAQPVRRAMLDRLREREWLVGELADELGIAQPMASKHLRVLRDAGFVAVRGDANRRWHRLRPEPLQELDEWLAPFRWMWESRLDHLGRHLDRKAAATAARGRSPAPTRARGARS